MTKPIIFVSLIVVGIIILIVIVRGILRAVRSTFSIASIVAVIVGVITTLVTRSKFSNEKKNGIEGDSEKEGDAASGDKEVVVKWVSCKYCGSKNKSSKAKCRNCGASL